jgi:ABC-2 type transport system permease protein
MSPIHDQGYRRYGGERRRQGRALAVIAWAGLRTLFGKRAFLALLILAWGPFFVRAVQLYAAANLPQAGFLAPTPQLFRDFLSQQDAFVFFITVFAGAGLIANDRRANALQIYLSKPLSRAEYIFGKLAVLLTLLLLVTWAPAILLLIVQILFAGNFTFILDHVFLIPAITAFSLIRALLAATLMLALSSLSTSSRYVGVMYAALVFFTQALSGVLRAVTLGSSLAWISLEANLEQVGDVIFRQPSRYDSPWLLSLLIVVATIGLSAVILDRRVRGVEVVT